MGCGERRCSLEIVSHWLTRVTSDGAEWASGDLIQIAPRLDRPWRVPHGGPIPAWKLCLSHPEKRPQPVPAAPCGDRGQIASVYEGQRISS
jgi:hypothetical protein